MKSGIGTTSTLVGFSGSITIKGRTLRIDDKAYAGLPVDVYVRPKNSSKFALLAALKNDVDQDCRSDAHAGRVVGVHAHVPRRRRPDGHPHR